MSISPINFNGMIQNTGEVVNARAHEDAKPQLQQAAVTVEITKREDASQHKVNNPDDTRQQDYRYDREGDGRGYKNSQKKMLKKKKDDKKDDGKVVVKPMSSFDIRI